MDWISVKDHLPTENGDYLVARDCFGLYRYYEAVSWANDLSELDKEDFPSKYYKGVSGFYDFNGECGYYEVSDVLAWCKVEPYEGE